MAVKFERVDGGPAKMIVTGMISSRVVLAAIAPKWDTDLFPDKYCNLIGNWCVNYFNQYNRAPRQNIENLFQNWCAKKERDPDTVELIDRFLTGISDEYDRLKESVNPQYVIDQAGEFFNRVKYKRLGEQLIDSVGDGDLEKAAKLQSEFSRLEMGGSSWFDPDSSTERIRTAVTHRNQSIIQYPDGLGKFFGESLEREGLICFLAPEKTGKTHALLDVAMTGSEQGRRTAFISCGDMTESQLMRRYVTKVMKRPIKAGTVRIPKYIEVEEGSDRKEGKVTVDHDEITYDTDMDVNEAIKACKRRAKENGTDGLFRMAVYPNNTISVHGIRSLLQTWARQGFQTDCVVIDYADIIAPLNGSAETRDQINATWKALSALRQEMRCLVVTASQTNAEGYKADVLTKSNFSEDKRKLAHCTGMIGINVDKNDKKNGVFRLNWVVLREGEFAESRCVYTAGCLAIGNPFILSRF